MTILERTVSKKGSLPNKALALFISAMLVLSMPSLTAFVNPVTEGTGQDPSSSTQALGDQLASTEAAVSLQTANAHIVIRGTPVTADTVSVPAGRDLVFTVQAETGFGAVTVFATDSATARAVTVAEASGTYTVAAADVSSTLAITVAASPVAAQEQSARTLPAPQAPSGIVAADASETVTLAVEYFYASGKRASNTWQSEYVPNESFQAPVPHLAGYDALA